MIKVLIADDHPIVRLGISKIVSKDPEIIIDGEAQNAQEIMEYIKLREVDVVVLDISMPDKSGLEVLEILRKDYPKISALILSMHAEEQYAIKAFKAGAAGYLMKKSAPEELINAIRKVASGGRYASHALAEKLVLGLDKNSEKQPHETLSNREFNIMCMIAVGKRPKEISEKLCISVKTVSTYRERILEKLQVSSNAELARYALENKLLD